MSQADHPVLAKVRAMQRNFFARRMKVAKGEMSKRRSEELCEQEEGELLALLTGISPPSLQDLPSRSYGVWAHLGDRKKSN